MCHPSKLPQLLLLALIATLVACSPAATPIPPTSTSIPPTSIPPTATNPPPTNSPTSMPTLPPRPTSTPGPVSRKFDAGGVNLYLKCMGQGSPTVVLDAGWGDFSSSWISVILGLRDQVQVCAYDRASLGQSDNQTGLRTSEQMAEQLHALLTSANVQSPYLVVGHSLGGMNMLVFADRYRDEIAGVVLVDSAHPDQADRWMAILPTPAPGELTSVTNLRRDIPWTNPNNPSFSEPMDWNVTLAQVRAVKSLGNIPLAVLVATDPTKNGWGNIPDDLIARLDKVWLDLHKEYLNLSTDSSLILAEHSGHFVHVDEPQVVVDAILKLVDKVRQR